MTRTSYIAVIALSLVAGIWQSGCTRSTVAPPPSSISSPLRPMLPPLGNATPPQLGRSNPWKPPVPARQWKYVVIHHTASKGGSVESIHESHLNNKDSKGNPWLGIGYHFVIGNGNGMGDGAIEPTFRWKQQLHGAHAGPTNKDHNEHGIGVCLVGNFETDHPTEAQRAAVKRLVQTLKTEYGISAGNVVGHRDIRATACPGKHFPMSEVAGLETQISHTQLTADPPPARLAAAPGSLFR